MQKGIFGLSQGAILGAVLTIAFIAPVIVLGGNKVIYVDRDNKGSEDGSKNHPYRSLDKALDKAKSGTEVHVAKGTYKENITIPKNVKVIGRKKDTSDVVIESESDKKPAVTMKDDSEIDHLTVKGGKHGILVEEDAEATIYDTTVKDADGDGIHIASGSNDKKYQVVISDSTIKENDKSGVYSGKKRNVVVVDSKINGNKNDGVDLSAGAKAWVNDSEIRDNRGSGAKVWISGSEITFKDNVIRGNGREGMEINSSGTGYVGLKKMNISGNGRYGVAKVARNAGALTDFGHVAIDNSGANLNAIGKNVLGSISHVMRGF